MLSDATGFVLGLWILIFSTFAFQDWDLMDVPRYRYLLEVHLAALRALRKVGRAHY